MVIRLRGLIIAKIKKVNTLTKILKIISAEAMLKVWRLLHCMVQSLQQNHEPLPLKVAEAAKIIENTQRDLNISLMNELSLIFDKMNINTYDVIEAAGTK